MDNYTISVDDNYWTSKYRPKTIKELCINDNIIVNFKNWLDNFKKNAEKARTGIKKKTRKIKNTNINTIDSEISNISDDDNIEQDKIDNNQDNQDNRDNQDEPKEISTKKKLTQDTSCLLVSGSHGCGKTSLVYTILNELKYNIKNINFIKYNMMKNTDYFLKKVLFNNSFQDKLYQKEINNNFCIVFDNIETLDSTNDRKIINNIIKENVSEWICPIIFISSHKHNKTMNLIKKVSFELSIPTPSFDNIAILLNKICIKEHILLENEKVAYKLIDVSQQDFRCLINTLQGIHDLYPKKIITLTLLEDFININKMKDRDYTIFEATDKLFYDYTNIDNAIRLFECERIVIPLMIQQHFTTHLNNSDMTTMLSISKLLSKGDILENYIYENNNYNIRDSQAFLQCAYPSYLLTKTFKQKGNYYKKYFSYPKDLNKTSIKRINFTKNISVANNIFK